MKKCREELKREAHKQIAYSTAKHKIKQKKEVAHQTTDCAHCTQIIILILLINCINIELN